MKRRKIYAADLFCGAGGSSTGLINACREMDIDIELTAVNHWDRAVETHAANHPDARHLCASLDSLDPSKTIKRRRLDLLVASPECTHHSIARGGKPRDDQSRASAWHVLHWCERLRVENVIIENVPEFQSWGPIGSKGQPLKSRKGETFAAFTKALESLGYRVSWRVLNCADYGDATTRRRLFITATRRRQDPWPMPSHIDPKTGRDLFAERAPWRPARDIIDWAHPSRSIFNRKRPLAENTLRRIEAGLLKFGGAAARDFLVSVCHGGGLSRRAHDLDRPLPTVLGSNQYALVQPFILGQHGGSVARSTDQPIPTVATAGAIRLIEPFLVSYYQNGKPHPVSKPVPTLTTKDRLGLVQPVGMDIHMRMLQPHELAAAMSFPADYHFAGNRTETVKQIGNAVPVRTAQALCAAAIRRAS